MALHAIITAGGKLPAALRQYSSSPIKALLPVGGRTLLETAVVAARGCPLIERVVAVGGEEVREAAGRLQGCEYIAEGSGVMDNIYNGYMHLGGEQHSYAIISPDLPFVSGAALQEFLEQAQACCEIGLPLVTRDDFLARFPGAPNTYERADGRMVTMGSAIYMTGPKLYNNVPLGRDFYRHRKYPHKLAALIGLPVILAYLTGSLRVAAVERRAARLTGASVRGIWVRDAAIAYDVDNLANYNYAAKHPA